MVAVQSKASGQVKDLLNRLNNAVKQRNAAREEALLAGQNLKKLEEDLESGALQVPFILTLTQSTMGVELLRRSFPKAAMQLAVSSRGRQLVHVCKHNLPQLHGGSVTPCSPPGPADSLLPVWPTAGSGAGSTAGGAHNSDSDSRRANQPPVCGCR